MAPDLKQLFDQACELTVNDRAALAGLLLESLEPPPENGVGEAWTEEIQRRWREIETGEVETIPWAEVRKKLLRYDK